MTQGNLGARATAWFPDDDTTEGTHHTSHRNSRFLQAMEWRLSKTPEYLGDESFCVMDLGHIYRQFQEWRTRLPSVRPFYAVKCNPDIHIIRVLKDLGAGFDCASKQELELVLAQGISPKNIILANPCKTGPTLRYAREAGVKKMTLDNEAELHKIKYFFPTAELILRCVASDPTAMHSLSNKFGATPETAVKLLSLAKALGLKVIGLSFHVGSGARDPSAFENAIRECAGVFRDGLACGHDIKLLDIGGGFLEDSFGPIAATVKGSLARYFGDLEVEVVAEPGRFFASGAMAVACGIVARREREENWISSMPMLYLNDGIYGVFLNMLFERMSRPQVLRISNQSFPSDEGGPTENYTVWGPTCDEVDCLHKEIELPANLAQDDWLYYLDMGAYSTCLCTGFNGFGYTREMIYVSSHPVTDEYLRKACDLSVADNQAIRAD